ncbi:hypothetical protein AAG570_004733 [Ranatra chinensis]|uniref:DNA/RNA-binding protein Kin17 WH-like domain-containing protein n=1 Tax=Ranatra chinensis TaxID=642074 RepID=A0ABD0Y1Q9_9HEMI
MGKHEVGTPKYIANKIKAKGLQKLRWYCQMCQKQCRDENGFKCHISSESHQRQLLIFADNCDRYLNEFSKEFADGYLELLSRQFGTKRVHANRVYQEYISDRHHLHMNSTQWETLTEFVKWLGREGKCVVDETEKGWFVTYIDRDPETIKLQDALAKKEKMDKDDNERMMEFLEKQIVRGKETSKKTEEHLPTDLVRKSEDETISLNMNMKKKSEVGVKLDPSALSSLKPAGKAKEKKQTEKRKLSALEEIIKEEEGKRKRAERKDYWLHEGIVVKVVTKSLGEKFTGKKGVVRRVVDKYCGESHVETVIPAIGRKVMVVNGGYRGLRAELKGIDTEAFSVTVRIASGPLNGKVVEGLPYEDISKLHVS